MKPYDKKWFCYFLLMLAQLYLHSVSKENDFHQNVFFLLKTPVDSLITKYTNDDNVVNKQTKKNTKSKGAEF